MTAMARRAPRWDVLVLGEILLELGSRVPLRQAHSLQLSFSGDALNAAAAAAAGGARTAVLSRISDDEVGDALSERVAELGVDTSLLLRTDRPPGTYIVVADTTGRRDFVYLRRGSAGSTLAPEDLPPFDGIGAVLMSGVTWMLSDSCAETMRHAATAAVDSGVAVVYDPNFRPRLGTAAWARRGLESIAPLAALLTPSCPGDSMPLLGTDDPVEVARACQALGAGAVAVTCGADGVLLAEGDRRTELSACPAPSLVDATGAGDVFAGTVGARLALGDPLPEAVRLGQAAAALSLAGLGGTDRIAGLEEVRALAARCADALPGTGR